MHKNTEAEIGKLKDKLYAQNKVIENEIPQNITNNIENSMSKVQESLDLKIKRIQIRRSPYV